MIAGPHRLDVREQLLDAGLRQHDHRLVTPQTVGAQLDLLGRLLAGHVERVEASLGELGEHLETDRRLADAGIAAEENDRSGDDAATEDAVELGEPGRDALMALRLDAVEAHRPAAAHGTDGERGSGARRRRSRARYRDLLDDALPGAALAAATEPLRELGATLLADERRPGASHAPPYHSAAGAKGQGRQEAAARADQGSGARIGAVIVPSEPIPGA
jgi:hypothetical protein